MLQVQVPTPPTPPPPPSIPVIPEAVVPTAGGDAILLQGGTGASPSAIYEAFKAQRSELTRQLSQLEERRRAIASRLRQGQVDGADKTGLEARLTELDGQINEMYKKVATANDQVARAAAQPGAVVPDRPDFVRNDAPPMPVIVMGFIVVMSMLVPISVAIAKRIARRGGRGPTGTTMSPDLDDRLTRLEQAMDAVAVEVERVGEGQRYMTRVLGSGAAEPIAVRERQAVEVKR